MSRFTIAKTTGVFYLPLDFPLQHGGSLAAGQLAFECVGPDGEDTPQVLVLGGISSGREVDRWWPGLIGPGKPLDTERIRVLSVDFLGGVGASTGPSNWQGEGPFPVLTSADQARALSLLLADLCVGRLDCFVGASYGGMVGLAFAAAHPEQVAQVVAIGAAHESHPMALAWRGLQRQIVRLGVASGCSDAAVALARGLAMTTYRSPVEFGARFDATPRFVAGQPRFAVEDYLAARGEAFAEAFSAEAFLALSQAIDLHRVDPAEITVPTLLVGFDTDQLVPPAQLRELAKALGGRSRHLELPSAFGHDGFLKEIEALTAVLGPILDSVSAGEGDR